MRRTAALTYGRMHPIHGRIHQHFAGLHEMPHGLAQRPAGAEVGVGHFADQGQGGGEHAAGVFKGFMDGRAGAHGEYVAAGGAAAEGGFKS